ncbi:MAG: hypothetical protein IT163_07470 [Bryobacterales bacterium]|nr:hypothetical protein [Bryobacterales bacterium]
MNAMRARQAAGVAVLAAAVAVMALLSVPYWKNRALGDDLTALVEQNGKAGWPVERWRVAALNVAARHGVAAAAAEVRVETRTGTPRVEIRYQKNVDLFVYTVRLHLRAKSGS